MSVQDMDSLSETLPLLGNSKSNVDTNRVKKETTVKEIDKSVSYFSLFKYANTFEKILVVIGVLTGILSGAAQPILLTLFGNVVGDIVNYVAKVQNATSTEEEIILKNKLYKNVYQFVYFSCGMGITTTLVTYLSATVFTYAAVKQTTRMRELFVKKILNMDIEWHDKYRTGDFAVSFTDNLSKIEDGIGEKASTYLFYESTFIAGIVFSLILGWKLTLIALAFIPLNAICVTIVAKLSTKVSTMESDSYSAAGSIAEEVLSAVRTVVAFGGQKKELDRYKKHLSDAKFNNIKLSYFNSTNDGLMWLMLFSNFAIVFWCGGDWILSGRENSPNNPEYTPGNVVAIFYVMMFGNYNHQQCSPILQSFGIACGAAVDVFAILNTEEHINKSKTTGTNISDMKGDITFKNVSFSYPTRPEVQVLNGLDFTIKNGQTVAIVGSSGCGKSTCVQLMQRFYDPGNGSIFLDDVDLQFLNLKWLRSILGVVSQEPVLFDTTIAENIRYGKITATQEEIGEAAKKSNAHSFIKDLPQGYETLIGERGAQISGGQKQRIAIARALVKKPRILLLDEATSALDTSNEAEVQAALDKASSECTTIIIAHRLSTIKNADRIIVMSNGRVVEDGNHQNLMKNQGAYFNLVKSQSLPNEKGESHVSKRTENVNAKPKLEKTDGSFRSAEIIVPLNLQKRDDTTTSVAEILKFSKPEWLYIALGCISSIAVGTCLPIFSLIIGNLIGVLANQNEDLVRQQVQKYCLFSVGLGLLNGISEFLQNLLFSVSGEKLTYRLRHMMFDKMLQQEISWYDKIENGVGSLCARLSGEAASVQGASGKRIGIILNCSFMFLLSNFIGLYYEWRLALMLLLFTPVIFFSTAFEHKLQARGASTTQQALEKSVKIAVEGISNIRTVASLGCEDIFYNAYVEEMNPYFKSVKRRVHFRGFIVGLSRSVVFFTESVVIYYGCFLIVEKNVPYANIFVVSEAVLSGAWGIGILFAYSPNFQKGLFSAGRILELLGRTPQIRDNESASMKPWKESNIEYSQVSFTYPTRPEMTVLKDLNLEIFHGKTVALVGSSGCGKSTIIQLLERFYDTNSGEVRADGQNIKQMTLSSLRSNLGIVSQEPNLFDRSIADNIAYGCNDREVDMNEIHQAAIKANIHNFITALPLGYETRLGSKGARLSGGQKQRIAIARALIRNPNVLLLDEATSALDNESEKVVQEALDKAREGRTCISIAHKLATIQDADVICVIKDGQVAEIGNHHELIEEQGLYYDFYKLQLSEE